MVVTHGTPPVWVRGPVAQQLSVVGDLGYRGYRGRGVQGRRPIVLRRR